MFTTNAYAYTETPAQTPLYEHLTYGEFAYLLRSPGTYLFILGEGGNDTITAVAKENKISTIYVFDPSHVVNITEKEFYKKLPVSDIALNTVVLYNKDRKNAANSPVPIVSTASLNANKDELATIFTKAEKLDKIDNYAYLSTTINKYAGTTILDQSDKDFIVQPVTYTELTDILSSEGTYVILFGGAWCPNTRAAIKYINQYAKKYGADKVYLWDIRYDSETLDIRDTKSPYAKLYVDLVNRYLKNIDATWKQTDNKAEHKVEYKDEQGTHTADKLQVPFLFVYNKDFEDTPVLGSIELMFTWENIQPDYVNDKGKTGANYNEYTENLDYVLSVLTEIDPGTEQTFPPEIIAKEITAQPTQSKVLLNGTEVAFDAYNINDNNYFKLRDIAYALKDKFSIAYDGTSNSISLISNGIYEPVGGELVSGNGRTQTAIPTASKVLKDGVSIHLTAYNIKGNNYFKLRDIGSAFEFGVDWDAAGNSIVIDTSMQ